MQKMGRMALSKVDEKKEKDEESIITNSELSCINQKRKQ